MNDQNYRKHFLDIRAKTRWACTLCLGGHAHTDEQHDNAVLASIHDLRSYESEQFARAEA